MEEAAKKSAQDLKIPPGALGPVAARSAESEPRIARR
jgi:hypothetical protein